MKPQIHSIDFFDRMESRMMKRKKMVEEVCKREGLGKYLNVDSLKTRHYPPTPNYEFLYFDLSNNLVWCPIYKSASTSWLYNFCNLAGISDDYLDNTNILEINNNKLKFFIVRHPFERLLSAYRDKLEKVVFQSPQRHETEFYYEKYGKRIVEKYRTKNPTSEAQSGSVGEVGKSLGIEPTFREFVTYLADLDLSRQAEEHWIPYYLYCTPCFIDYDIIAKFETLYEDQVFIIAKSNLQDKISPKWKRLSKGGRTSYVAEKYYSTLSKELLLKLYDKYKLDFDMFDYNLDEYLNYAR
ncbi:Carbohydrate sulfotransferase 11 [Armadillidium vulgare]|nr:Carbohydrate sulfotransferase 11 [Armadillidium vulgare]